MYKTLLLLLFVISFQSVYPQKTKIFVSKKNSPGDTQCVYVFNIMPSNGDSVYVFEISLFDSLTKVSKILSVTMIAVKIDSQEVEKFTIDEHGNKKGTIFYDYLVTSYEEYSDNNLKIPLANKKRTLQGEIIIYKQGLFKFVFNNLRSSYEEFYFLNGEILKE